MNTNTLLQHFDEISEAPDAVSRLRRFILDLAVRGKLVEQDPGDEPASELFRRIEVERRRLEEAKKKKKGRCPPELEMEDAPFELPGSWLWVKLGRIGDWGSGSTPSRGVTEYYGGDVSWLKSGELRDRLALVGSEETVSELALEECTFRRNQPGDVLVAMYGATIGKLAILGEEAVTNQAVCGCTPFPGVINRYLFDFLLSWRTHFHTLSEGGAQPNISKVKIINTPFPLPPLGEQHRIVVKVDELMALCDELEAAQTTREKRRDRLVAATLHRLNNGDTDPDSARTFKQTASFYFNHLPRLTTKPEHIRQLRQTILNLAVRGKLVPQHSGEEPGLELFNRIRSERERLESEGKAARIKALPPIAATEVPFSIPPSWAWVRTQEISTRVSDGVHKKPNYVDSGVPFITVRNLTAGSGISFQETKFISEADHEQFIKRTHPEKGDVLITKDGTIGVTRVIETDRVFSIFVSVALVKLVERRTNAFFALCLNSGAVQSQIVPKGAALKHLHLVDLRHLPIPLPPLAEQCRLLAKLDEMMALCSQLDSQLSDASTISHHLLEATINETLTGGRCLSEAGS